jgi:hypothetical protein
MVLRDSMFRDGDLHVLLSALAEKRIEARLPIAVAALERGERLDFGDFRIPGAHRVRSGAVDDADVPGAGAVVLRGLPAPPVMARSIAEP